MYYGASHKLFRYAKEMRAAPTEAESKVWELLTSEPLREFKFRRQHPLANYIADFYCHALKVVIEVDGGIHERREQKEYDKFRDSDMVQFGITVLRFTNEQVLEQPEIVKEEIYRFIKEHENGYADPCP